MLPTINTLIINEHAITAHAYKNVLLAHQNDLKFKLLLNVSDDPYSIFDIIENGKSEINYQLFILDTNLTFFENHKICSIEKLCCHIKQNFSKAKIIITTSSRDNLRLFNLITTINPDGLLVKSDITNLDLSSAVKHLISGNPYYSTSVIKLLRKKISQKIVLDNIDTEILKELSNGAKMMELLNLIPLTKSGIEKRKRRLKQIFRTKSNSDRELVLSAKERGFL